MTRAPRVALTLLTRGYCHLCDDMRDALRRALAGAPADVTELDVDDDAVLESRFGDRVPVLLEGGVDGTELCHFRLDRDALRRVLAAPR